MGALIYNHTTSLAFGASDATFGFTKIEKPLNYKGFSF
jgi:hypothetical protein